jgi:methylmalonyl-CoA mutase C-terminal domain/subunit
MERKIRVLLAKPGLDGHDRGVKVIAAAMRDAGFEVIYSGLRQTPEMIVRAAVDEDVDAIGLSILSGAHMTLFPRVHELLVQEGADGILLTGGGIISQEDMQKLKDKGVGELFRGGPPPGCKDARLGEGPDEHYRRRRYGCPDHSRASRKARGPHRHQ